MIPDWLGVKTPEDPEACTSCSTCLSKLKTYAGIPVTMTMMVVCPRCGDKHCPRAAHHGNECTNA